MLFFHQELGIVRIVVRQAQYNRKDTGLPERTGDFGEAGECRSKVRKRSEKLFDIIQQWAFHVWNSTQAELLEGVIKLQMILNHLIDCLKPLPGFPYHFPEIVYHFGMLLHVLDKLDCPRQGVLYRYEEAYRLF